MKALNLGSGGGVYGKSLDDGFSVPDYETCKR